MKVKQLLKGRSVPFMRDCQSSVCGASRRLTLFLIRLLASIRNKISSAKSPHISHIVDLDTDYTVRIGKSNLNRFYLCRNKRFLLFRQNRPFLKSQQQKSNLRFNIIHDVLKLANNDRRQTLPFQRSEVFVVSPG